MDWKVHYKHDRLLRKDILDHSSAGTGKRVIATNIRSDKHAFMLAAAPELLEALTLMMQCHREPHGKEGVIAWEMAQDAIAKAEAAQ